MQCRLCRAVTHHIRRFWIHTPHGVTDNDNKENITKPDWCSLTGPCCLNNADQFAICHSSHWASTRGNALASASLLRIQYS